jgi:putative Holliday junction resolvase
MTTLTRILGIDYGEKRIGLAISDPLLITAQGMPTLVRKGGESDLQAIRNIVEERNVSGIVIGLPRRMDGTLGTQARRVEDFAARLAEITGLPVDTWDERLTTVAAERALLEGDVRRKKRRGLRDRLAAVLILQGWLDRRAQRKQNGEV